MVAVTDSTQTGLGSPLRRVGIVLLASLYAVIAWSKLTLTFDAVEDLRDEAGAHHVLIAVHSLSGVLFFGALAAVSVFRPAPVRREHRPIGWILPMVVMGLFFILGRPEPTTSALWLVIPATLFAVLGTAATLVSLRRLGSNFGVVSDVRGFVSSGPYRRVRHPLYASELVTSFGLLLVVLSPLTVAAFVFGAAAQVARARVEEQAVTAAFPEYQDYARRTPMLIPRIRVRP